MVTLRKFDIYSFIELYQIPKDDNLRISLVLKFNLILEIMLCRQSQCNAD